MFPMGKKKLYTQYQLYFQSAWVVFFIFFSCDFTLYIIATVTRESTLLPLRAFGHYFHIYLLSDWLNYFGGSVSCLLYVLSEASLQLPGTPLYRVWTV